MSRLSAHYLVTTTTATTSAEPPTSYDLDEKTDAAEKISTGDNSHSDDTTHTGRKTYTDDKAYPDEKTIESTTASSGRPSSIGTDSEPVDRVASHGIPIVDTTEDADEKQMRALSLVPTQDDPNVLDWDGADDPARAVNWTKKKKWGNIAIIALVTFLTPLASAMVAPAIPVMMKDFRTSDQTIASFIVSIYILGYAIGPLVLAPLSELYGRLPIYHICNALFVVWNIACAVAPNIGSLLVFRLFAGIAGSCPITIGAGSIADIFIPQERGGAMAIFAMGPILGPVIGPVAGGYLSAAKGWRWIFWVITMAGGVALAAALLFMRETYDPTLLQQRVNKVKKETGNTQLRSKLEPTISHKEYFKRSIVRPTKMLLLSPIVLIFSMYMAIVYGYLYLLFTTLTFVYEGIYHFSQGSVGLTYLGIGVGSLLGLVIFGVISDRLLKSMAAKNNGEIKPEFRLPPLIPASFMIPIGLFWYGWSAQYRIHWIMPIIGTAWVGFGMLATFMPIQTYMVDAFNQHAASAVAANTVLRSLVGAFLPLAGPKMYEALGLGWGNSLLGFIALAMLPVPFIFYKYGERIRNSKRFHVEF